MTSNFYRKKIRCREQLCRRDLFFAVGRYYALIILIFVAVFAAAMLLKR